MCPTMKLVLSQLNAAGEVVQTSIHTTTAQKPIIEVGRLMSADLRLNSPNVAHKHATFEVENGAVKLIDLAPTYKNGSRINTAIVEKDDTLRFGDVTFRVESIDIEDVKEDTADPQATVRSLKELKERLSKNGGVRSNPRSNPSFDSPTLIAIAEALCDTADQLHEDFPAQRVADALDRLITDADPILKVVIKRAKEANTYIAASIKNVVLQRAALIKEVRDKNGLSEEAAMKLVAEETAVWRESLLKLKPGKSK